MNNLKAVNDNFGHTAGDSALLAIAKAILAHIKSKDRAYRIGGDEFVILLFHDEVSTMQIIESVVTQISDGGKSVAYGYEFYDGNGNFENSYKEADKKMYTCKKSMKQCQNDTSNQ